MEKIFMLPINQLFEIAFPEDIDLTRDDIFYCPSKRSKRKIFLDKPLFILMMMLDQKLDLQILFDKTKKVLYLKKELHVRKICRSKDGKIIFNP